MKTIFLERALPALLLACVATVAADADLAHPTLADLYPTSEQLPLPEGGPDFSNPVDVDQGLGKQRIAGVPGETVDPRSGVLELGVVDLTLPGAGGLPLMVSRTRRASFFAQLSDTYVNDGSFQETLADWRLDIPHIELVSVNNYQQGNVVKPYTPLTHDLQHLGSLHQGVCLSPYPPNPVHVGQTTGLPSPSPPFLRYFGGVRLRGIAGQPDRELLLRNQQERVFINSRYVTADNWVVRCEGSAYAPNPNSRFVVQSPDGTTYTFDEPTRGNNLALSGEQPFFGRMRVFVSRIEDRNGNSLSFEYDNSLFSNTVLNHPSLGRYSPDLREYAYVKRIVASDGRVVTFEWEANPFVPAGRKECRGDELGACGSPRHRLKSFSYGERKWQYVYSDVPVDPNDASVGRYLTGVILPNGQRYTYQALAGTTNTAGLGCVGYPYGVPQPINYRITFPEGGVVDYEMTTRRFARRNGGGGNCWYATAVKARHIKSTPDKVATTQWCYGPTELQGNTQWTHVVSQTRHEAYNFEREGSDGRWWGEGLLASHQIRPPIAACPASVADPGAGYLRKISYSYEQGSAFTSATTTVPGYASAIAAPRKLVKTATDDTGAGSYEETKSQHDAFAMPQLARESVVNELSTAASARRSKVRYRNNAYDIELSINQNLARAYWFSGEHEQVEFWARRPGGNEFLVHRGGPPASGPVILNVDNFTPGIGLISISMYPSGQHLPSKKLVEFADMSVQSTSLTTYRKRAWQLGLPEESCLVTSDTANCAYVDGIRQSEQTSYDERGNVVSTLQYGVQTGSTYTGAGDLQSVTDGRLNTTVYANHKRGIPQLVTHPANLGSEQIEIDDYGQTRSMTNANGVTTRYDFDTRGRLKLVDYEAGSDASIVWSADGRQRTITRGRLKAVSEFDGFGRLLRDSSRDTVRDIMVSRDYRYNSVGNKEFESYPLLGPTGSAFGEQTVYDALDRPVRTVRTVDGAQKTVEFLPPETQRRTDFNDVSATLAYRSYGKPAYEQILRSDIPYTHKDAAGTQQTRMLSTVYTRDVYGVVQAVRQGAVTRRYGVDGRRQQVKEYQPELEAALTADGYNLTLCRDEIGQIVGRSIGATCSLPAAANVAEFTYDARDRLKTADFRDTANNEDMVFDYDGVGKIKRIVKGATTASFSYDAMNNLCTQSRAVDGYSLRVGYDYDDLQYPTAMIYPSGKRYALAYDAFGNLRSVAGIASSIDYYASGQMRSVQFANGQSTDIGLNELDEPVSITTQSSAGPLVKLVYGYDTNGNINSATDQLVPAESMSYRYDELNRLVEYRRVKTNSVYRRGYDDIGNVMFDQSPEYPQIDFTYDVRNRLASAGGSVTRSFTYDTHGNMTDDGQRTTTFSFDGNLVSAAVNGSSKTLVYDGRDRLLKEVKPSGTYYYFYSGENLIFEFDPTRDRYTEYVYAGATLLGSRTVESASSADSDLDGVTDTEEFRGTGWLDRCASNGSRD